MKPIVIYFIIINLVTYILFGVDKWKAVHKRWRIPERTLLTFCLVGGAFGGFAAMYSFTHKIHKNIFRYPVPVMMVLDIAALYYLLTL